MSHIKENPSQFEDGNILFWHTGNALGMFSKVDELMMKEGNDYINLQNMSPVKRLNIYGEGPTVPN